MICGDEDEGTPPDRNQLIASKIPGGRYEGIAKARHLPNVERPEQFNRIMMTWLGRQPLRTHHGFRLHRRPARHQGQRRQAVRPVRRQVLAEEGQGRRLPRRLLPRHGRCRLARHRHAGGVWRRGPRHHRGGDHDADGGRVGRGPAGRLGDPSQHLRAQPDRGVRHRGAEAAHPARHHQGQGEGLLRRHRARCRPQHHGARHQGRARRQRLRRARQEDLDHDGAGRRQDAADRPHHAARRSASGRPTACRCSTPTSTAPRSRCARSRRWAARRSTPTRCSSTG